MSVPTICEFMPLKQQHEVLHDIRRKYNYELGTHEILLSGAVGSAKSLLLAHIIATHALENPQANIGVGRRTLPSLRDTLIAVIQQHLGEDVQFDYNKVKGQFTFSNGSIIRPFSWADGHFKKFRSHEFSMFAIDELTETYEKEFYDEILGRVGRLDYPKEKLLVCATNPDDPEHWAYNHFFVNESPTKHVYLSRTDMNPYLPRSYIEGLKELYDPKMYKRMVLGEWLAIKGDVIYHQYDPENNRSRNQYQVTPHREIHWCWDFNIGEGKPLSTCFFQHDGQMFHIYKDIVVEGLRTEDMLEEAYNMGLLDWNTTYVINGDATGKHRDTRSRHNDYEIIRKWLSNQRNRAGNPIKFRMDVPISNPKVRERHNIMNSQLQNAAGVRSLMVYPDAPMVHEGLMLTKLRPGANYIEDDRRAYQHVTTSLGYGVVAKLRGSTRSAVTVIRR